MMPMSLRATHSIRQVLKDFLSEGGESGRVLAPDWGIHRDYFKDCGFDGIPSWAKATNEEGPDAPYYWFTREEFVDGVVERWGEEGRDLVYATLMEIEKT